MQRSTPYRPPLRRPDSGGNAAGNGKIGRCPYLGADADPTTALAFPSEANHCFRTNQPIPISLIHQETFCLANGYDHCPVFQQNLGMPEPAAFVALASVAVAAAVPVAAPLATPPAPAGLAAVALADAAGVDAPPVYAERGLPEFKAYEAPAEAMPAGRRASAASFRTIVVGLLFIGLLAAGWWVWESYQSQSSGESLDGLAEQPTQDAQDGLSLAPLPTLSPSAVVSGLLAGLATLEPATAEAESSAAGLPPTATPLPMPTDTSAQILAIIGSATPSSAAGSLPTATLEALALPSAAPGITPAASPNPTCRVPASWVPYVIQQGDTLSWLSYTRNVPIREIVSANCLRSNVAILGMTIYLPPPGGTGVPARPTVVLNGVTAAPTLPGTSGLDPEPTSEPGPTRLPLPTATTPFQPTSPPPTATQPASRPTATPPGQNEPTKTPPPEVSPTSPPASPTPSGPTPAPTATPPAVPTP